MVDLSIYNNGETAQPLEMLVQEIDILMQARHQTVITNYQPGNDLDKYLFKNGVNANTVARQVQDAIMENCHIPTGFTVNVNANFMSTSGNKDMLYVEIAVMTNDTANIKQLSYLMTS